MTMAMFWAWFLRAKVNLGDNDDDGLHVDTCMLIPHSLDSDKISEYDLKLMDIDSEHLGIPDTTYDAVVTMSSTRFAEIVRDLSMMNDSGKYSFYIHHHPSSIMLTWSSNSDHRMYQGRYQVWQRGWNCQGLCHSQGKQHDW